MRSKSDKAIPGSRSALWLYGIVMAVLAFTGFGQMPIFKRYYISSAPGMSWAGDYYVTLVIHYLGAVLLLGFIGYMATKYLVAGRKGHRITSSGYLRMALLAGLVGTGIFHLMRNMPEVDFSPGLIMMMDISHLVFTMAYLAAAALFWFMKAGWVAEKTS